MSETDSFINEVTEEVRRDRLFALMRRYGWIAVLIVLLLVGGATWSEWNKAKERANAQATGDALLAGLRVNDAKARVEELAAISPESEGGKAVAALLTAGEQADAGETDAAVAGLKTVAQNPDLPLIYRQVAEFKLLAVQGDTLSIEQRRDGYKGLIGPKSQLGLLAEEQLALLDIEAGDTDAAGARLQKIASAAGATPGLRRRATQLMVALGVEPDVATQAATQAAGDAADAADTMTDDGSAGDGGTTSD
ncbi:tetratricopeptide repeat protein [Aquicoccus sp. G2-2]|uniref:tetratricopeptide repeat protein n=1 Tax=Aquicoccus sp. G2-2 TaxID=3092120 RepID=UPI002AE0016B|nr:tetratricopeptide repeat protein [Aquicoccus sp. G2-2]MEA1112714.1 tetratricopeptide repeat protein [Aquicoccus sp. G2-2]